MTQNYCFDEFPAHIFSLTTQAYNKFKNQCIIINGESGSGKTFNVKLVLEFLALKEFDSCLFKQVVNGLTILEGKKSKLTIKGCGFESTNTLFLTIVYHIFLQLHT